MSKEKRYGVIAEQGNGFYCEGFTAAELGVLVVQSNAEEMSMDELFGDEAITCQVISDLLAEVSIK